MLGIQIPWGNARPAASTPCPFLSRRDRCPPILPGPPLLPLPARLEMGLVDPKLIRACAVDLLPTHADIGWPARVGAHLDMPSMLVFALSLATTACIEGAEVGFRVVQVPLQRSLISLVLAAAPPAEETAGARTMREHYMVPTLPRLRQHNNSNKSCSTRGRERQARGTYTRDATSGRLMWQWWQSSGGGPASGVTTHESDAVVVGGDCESSGGKLKSKEA